jgi:hypothetical protein
MSDVGFECALQTIVASSQIKKRNILGVIIILDTNIRLNIFSFKFVIFEKN